MHTVKPGPVQIADVFTNDTDVYVTFNSPKPGKSLKYNVSLDCAEDGSREVNCSVGVIHCFKPLILLNYKGVCISVLWIN